jgi:RND family efflux transporter MFP subunit
VTVAEPLDREVQEWDEYPGRLEAKEVVDVRPRVSGYVESVHFKEGGIVSKGDLLFVIDPRPYQAELERARGEVSRAKARLMLAQTEFKRTKGLVPSAAASELELEERRANLAEAQAAVAVAQANLKTAELNLAFTRVRAEINGRISRVNVTVGNLVTGGAQGEATLLTTITSLHPIYCYVDADERSVLKYQRLARENKRPSARDAQIPARLALLNEEEFVHEGVIDFVDNRVDPTTGTLRARGVFPNEDGVMTPGLFGRLRVPGSPPYRTLLVAQSAVQADQGRHYVLTVDAENTVRITPVKLGAAFGPLRAITSGLTGNEMIIVNGVLRARPGGKVNPARGAMPGADHLDTLTTTRAGSDGDGTPPGATTAPTTAPAPAPTTEPTVRAGDDGDQSRVFGAAAAPAAGRLPFGTVAALPTEEVSR